MDDLILLAKAKKSKIKKQLTLYGLFAIMFVFNSAFVPPGISYKGLLLPKVTITSHSNSSSSYKTGDNTTISWYVANAPSDAKINIQFSDVLGSGGNVVNLVIGTTNDGRQSVTIPNVTPGRYYFKVYVSGYSSSVDYSDGYINVESSVSAPKVTITSHNNSSTSLKSGDRVTLTWSVSNAPSTAKINLQFCDGTSSSSNVVNLALGTANDGSHTVTIPDVTPGRYYFKAYVSGYSNSVDYSDGYINVESSVSAPKVTITSHNNSSTSLKPGDRVSLTWSVSNAPSTAKINLQFSDGTSSSSNVVNLALGTANDGSHTVTIPDVTPGRYYFKAYVSGYSNSVDYSDGYINVESSVSAPKVTITSHNNSSTSLKPGDRVSLTWSVSNAPSTAKINLQFSDGTSSSNNVVNLALGTANDGSQTVIIPDVNPGRYYFKVYVSGYSNSVDYSDGYINVESSVSAPKVTITSHNNSSSSLKPGNTATVSWSVVNAPSDAKMNIQFSDVKGNGGNVTNLALAVANDGSQAVVIPDVAPGYYFFKIYVSGYSASVDYNDGIIYVEKKCDLSVSISGEKELVEGDGLSLLAECNQSGVVVNWATPIQSIAGDLVTVPSVTIQDAGQYTATATKDGCTATAIAQVVVEEPACNLEVNIVGNKTLKQGEKLELLAECNQAGATVGWETPKQSVAGDLVTVPTATSQDAGQYTVTVTKDGCTATATVQVVVEEPNCDIEVSIVGNTSLKQGDKLELLAECNQAGATVGWETPKQSVAGDLVTVPTATSQDAGQYTVTVTKDGCTATATAQVVVEEPNCDIEVSIVGNTSIKQGDKLELLAECNQAGTTVGWETPKQSVAGDLVTVPTATSQDAGQYTVTVTKDECTATATVQVVVEEPNCDIEVSIVGNTSIKQGDKLELLAECNQAGATVGWETPKQSVAGDLVTVPTATSQDAGHYVATATKDGCTASDTVLVVLEAATKPTVEILTPVNNEEISNYQYKVTGTANITGGYIDSVKIRINDGPWTTAKNIGGSLRNWERTLNLTSTAKTIEVQSVDNLGVQSEIALRQIIVNVADATFCQCPIYVRNLLGLPAMGNANDWIYNLPKYGYEEVFDPELAEVVVIDKGANTFGAAGQKYGHVGIPVSFTQKTIPYTLTIRGSNQSLTNIWTEAGCNNVSLMNYSVNSTTIKFVHYYRRSERGSSEILPWNKVDIQPNSASILAKATINGYPLMEGAYVGAFSDTTCIGYSIVKLINDESIALFNIQLSEAEQDVTFKLLEDGVEYNILTPLTVTAGTTIGSPDNPYLLEGNTNIVQVLSLRQGWNLISLFVEPENRSVDAIFAPIKDLVVEVKNELESYNPDYGSQFQTLTALKSGYYGYWVKVSEACTLNISGLAVDATKGRDIYGGWSLVGHPYSSAMSIESAYNQSWVEEVKTEMTFYNPEFGTAWSTLQELSGGQGYWLKTKSDLSLKYTLDELLASKKSTNVNSSCFDAPVVYTNSTVLMAEVKLDNLSIDEGSVVAAFVGDECRALGNVVSRDGKSYVSLVVNGTKTEQASLKLCQNNEVYHLEGTITSSPGNTLLQDEPILFHKSLALNIDSDVEHRIRISPNPSNGAPIRIDWPAKLAVKKVEVFNSTGLLIAILNPKNNTCLWQVNTQSKGVYFIKVVLNDKLFVKKVIRN